MKQAKDKSGIPAGAMSTAL